MTEVFDCICGVRWCPWLWGIKLARIAWAVIKTKQPFNSKDLAAGLQ